jgi:hypothetical protein
MLETAISSVDINAFSTAETAAVAELKSALANAKAGDFTKYVDKGLDMARELLRGKLRVPKVSTQLELPIDMTFSEQFALKVIVNNTGDGDALRLNMEWHLDEGIDIVSGEKQISMSSLPAGQSMTFEIHAKSAEALEGMREYTVMVRGSYGDMLNSEYSLQAGPGTLVLKDFKESEKLLKEIESIAGKYQALTTLIPESKLDNEPLDRILSGIGDAINPTKSEVSENKLESAKGRLHVIDSFIETIDSLLKDQKLIDNVTKKRETEKRYFAIAEIEPLKENIAERFSLLLKKIDDETEAGLSEWDSRTDKKKKVVDQISNVKDRVTEINKELENLYSKMPTAADTEDPEEAKVRTKLRTSVDSVMAKVTELQTALIELSSAQMLEDEERPMIPDRVALAKDFFQKIMDEVMILIDSKKSELT